MCISENVVQCHGRFSRLMSRGYIPFAIFLRNDNVSNSVFVINQKYVSAIWHYSLDNWGATWCIRFNTKVTLWESSGLTTPIFSATH